MAQPEIIDISSELRLRRYDGNFAIFLRGYSDPYVYKNSEGITDPANAPDLNYVEGMCKYLSEAGELYYIEVLEDGVFIPIGDVTVKAENPPIAIWFEKYRSRGIGFAVMSTVIRRLSELGVTKITGSTIYKWNTPSQKLHERLGFVKVGESEDEFIYSLDIK